MSKCKVITENAECLKIIMTVRSIKKCYAHSSFKELPPNESTALSSTINKYMFDIDRCTCHHF